MMSTIFSEKNLQIMVRGSIQPILSHTEDSEPFYQTLSGPLMRLELSKSPLPQTSKDG